MKSIIIGAVMHVAFGMDCLGVVDKVGTPISVNSCVSSENFETNETLSFKYECDTDGLNQVFYNDASCAGTPTEIHDATQNVIEFNCDTTKECESFDISIISGAQCGINATNTTSHNGQSEVSMTVVAGECVNITSLNLPSRAVSAVFLCNSTHYQVTHYSGMKTIIIRVIPM